MLVVAAMLQAAEVQISRWMSTFRGPWSSVCWIGCQFARQSWVFPWSLILKLDARCFLDDEVLWLFRRIPVLGVNTTAVDMLSGSARVW